MVGGLGRRRDPIVATGGVIAEPPASVGSSQSERQHPEPAATHFAAKGLRPSALPRKRFVAKVLAGLAVGFEQT
jgi:hypothetical protein